MNVAPLVILLLLAAVACRPDNSTHSAPKAGLMRRTTLRQLNLHESRIRLQVPVSWTHQRKLRVWGPDCKSCSGGEYSYLVSTIDSSSLASISVTIYPAGNNRFRSVAEELKIMAVKDPQAIVIKTFVSVSQRIRVIYLESWRDQKPVLFAIKDVTSPYRQLSVYIQMPKTAENLDLIKRMLETVEVDKAYMTEPYKQSY